MTDFSDWLSQEIRARGWTEAEFARQAGGISPQAVNFAINRQTKPGPKLCRAIARAFGVPIEDVYRRAGLWQPEPPNELVDDMLGRLRRLPAADQERVLALWRTTLEVFEGLRHPTPPA